MTPRLSPAVLDALRKACGYRFPRLGARAHSAVLKMAPRYLTAELFPRIRVPLDLHDDTQRATYWQGERFEFPTALVLRGWAFEATHFFDIGANYGFYTLMLASRFPQVRIHSFEPSPNTARALDAVVRSNNLTSVTVHHIGLGDTRATLPLHLGAEDSGHSTFADHPGLRHATAQVPVVPFDAWRRDQGLPLPQTPTWVAKIDVEGFETAVLRGMREALRARAFRGLTVEVLPYTLGLRGERPDDIRQLLASFGYRLRAASHRTKTANEFFEPA